MVDNASVQVLGTTFKVPSRMISKLRESGASKSLLTDEGSSVFRIDSVSPDVFGDFVMWETYGLLIGGHLAELFIFCHQHGLEGLSNKIADRWVEDAWEGDAFPSAADNTLLRERLPQQHTVRALLADLDIFRVLEVALVRTNRGQCDSYHTHARTRRCVWTSAGEECTTLWERRRQGDFTLELRRDWAQHMEGYVASTTTRAASIDSDETFMCCGFKPNFSEIVAPGYDSDDDDEEMDDNEEAEDYLLHWEEELDQEIAGYPDITDTSSITDTDEPMHGVPDLPADDINTSCSHIEAWMEDIPGVSVHERDEIIDDDEEAEDYLLHWEEELDEEIAGCPSVTDASSTGDSDEAMDDVSDLSADDNSNSHIKSYMEDASEDSAEDRDAPNIYDEHAGAASTSAQFPPTPDASTASLNTMQDFAFNTGNDGFVYDHMDTVNSFSNNTLDFQSVGPSTMHDHSPDFSSALHLPDTPTHTDDPPDDSLFGLFMSMEEAEGYSDHVDLSPEEDRLREALGVPGDAILDLHAIGSGFEDSSPLGDDGRDLIDGGEMDWERGEVVPEKSGSQVGQDEQDYRNGLGWVER